jgi:hypothetical protein
MKKQTMVGFVMAILSGVLNAAPKVQCLFMMLMTLVSVGMKKHSVKLGLFRISFHSKKQPNFSWKRREYVFTVVLHKLDFTFINPTYDELQELIGQNSASVLNTVHNGTCQLIEVTKGRFKGEWVVLTDSTAISKAEDQASSEPSFSKQMIYKRD